MASPRRVWADVDLGALVRNYGLFQRWAPPPTEVMAVVKADAYGHGATHVVRALTQACDARWFGVATLDEACEVRGASPDARILVLSPLLPEDIDCLIACRATPVISDDALVGPLSSAAQAQGITLPVHVEVDTGMGRCGVLPAQLPKLVRLIRSHANLELEGLMTHFPNAEDDASGTLAQLASFVGCSKDIERRGHGLLLHAANSAGAFMHPSSHLDLIRPGMALYGLSPLLPEATDFPEVEPILTLKARVLLVRHLDRGHPISYGSTYVLRRPGRVAVLGIGYADGYRREFSNRACVAIHGRLAPVIGRVCMDMTMVDVTDIPPVEAGDIATMIGRDGEVEVKAVELARMIGATEHEITTGLSLRVPRRWIGVC